MGIRSYQMSKALLELGHQVLMVCGSYQGGTLDCEISSNMDIEEECLKVLKL